MENEIEKIFKWFNQRFPLQEIWNKHAVKYYASKNLNFWYFFGFLSFVILMNQILTGIFLTMHYTPTSAEAYKSVQHIMRNVRYGWLLRYMHSTGASAFFIVIYLHMYRGIMYGSYKAPRELVWVIGMFIYFFLLMESSTGYVLPWGQMSYWATKVLVSISTVIPYVGESISTWLEGDYNVTGNTLHHFFSFHIVLIPLIILFLAWMHLIALHRVGSNNPDGIDVPHHLKKGEKNSNVIPFHPFYSVKDFMGIVLFLFIFAIAIFYMPTMGGYFLEHQNLAPANPTVTPAEITPPWYMAPFYSILRSTPNKYLGVIFAAGAIALLFILPWLDRSKVRSIRYRGVWSRVGLVVLVVSFVMLGYLGTIGITNFRINLARFFTVLYFLFFITLPYYSRYEKTKPLPHQVHYP